MGRQQKALVGLIAGGFLLVAAPAPARTWTEAGGGRQIDAEFVGMAAGHVLLRKTTGRVVAVPLTRLQSRDRELARRLDALHAASASQKNQQLRGTPHDAQWVVVQGSGADSAAALHRALEKAVGLVAGPVVDSELRIEDGSVPSYQLRIFNRGLVIRFEVLEENHHEHHVQQTVAALVHRRRWTPTARDKLAVLAAVDGRGLASAWPSRTEEQGLALLETTLARLPAEITRVSLAETPQVVGDDHAAARLRLAVRLSVDPSRYQRAKLRLLELLNGLQLPGGILTAEMLDVPTRLDERAGELLVESFFGGSSYAAGRSADTRFAHVRMLDRTGARGPRSGEQPPAPPDGARALVLVNTAVGTSSTSSRWRWYALQRRLQLPGGSGHQIKLTLRDAVGLGVGRKTVDAALTLPGLARRPRRSAADLQVVVVSPMLLRYVIDSRGEPQVLCARSVSFPVEVSVPRKQLASVSTVHVRVAEAFVASTSRHVPAQTTN